MKLENDLLLGLKRHSHPMTFKKLKRLIARSEADFSQLIIDESLNNLCTKISIIHFDNKRSEISISISDKVIDNSNQAKRIFKCYSFWIAYCLEISYTLRFSFQLYLNASDFGVPDFLSMTSKDQNIVVPDEYSLFESKQIKKITLWKTFQEFKENWLRRKPLMFWRGSTTGHEIVSTCSLQELIRVKTCLMFRDINGFDLKISNIVQNSIPTTILRQWLNSNDILRGGVNEAIFGKYKYYPDLPGNNQLCGSWGVIRKFLRGNLVFRPNYKSKMYYDRFIKEWEHYVPVRSDFSDLNHKYLWAENNQEEALMISWRGYCMSKNYLENIKGYFIEVCTKHLRPL